MKFAMIGLGKMGANMVRRLINKGHEAQVYDVDYSIAQNLAAELDPVHAVKTITDLFSNRQTSGVIWMMVPHECVDDTLASLQKAGLSAGDVVIDGGNSNYKHSKKRASQLAEKNILFVDCGTSGGVWGLDNGYSIMVGGSTQAVETITPLLQSLAPEANSGWGHVGPSGAGHYTKMVHNGIEYGMMQAYAEGFELMEAKKEFNLDLEQISAIWQQGSVVRSWLLDLIHDALGDEKLLESLSDYVDDSGEGRWTIQDSIENAVPTPVLSLALQMRFRSRQESSYAGKILNAMRAGFGGHSIRPEAKSG